MKSAIRNLVLVMVLLVGGFAMAQDAAVEVVEVDVVEVETMDAAEMAAEQQQGVWWGNRSISNGNYLKFDKAPATECPYGCPHCRGSKRCCEVGPDCKICDFANGPCFVCPPMYFDKIFFDLDKAVLRPDGIIECDKIVKYLNVHSDVDVVIEGHTCDLAPTDYNIGLGNRRANSVKTYLQNHGIAASRMSTKTFGESTPWVGIPQRELNRRAIVVVVP